MSDEIPYTNREIKILFDSQNKTLERIEKMILDEVVPLKKEMATLLLWREGIMGKISVVIIVFGSLWTLGVAYVTSKFH